MHLRHEENCTESCDHLEINPKNTFYTYRMVLYNLFDTEQNVHPLFGFSFLSIVFLAKNQEIWRPRDSLENTKISILTTWSG